ncbi:type IV secretion protein Rhs [Neisseria arctica]|uniref:Type IV secretion protein Rhs n=1 Tax=Neisseria arctica TaxID=1470200 RepID=A0A0J0YU45_9NEIS|nr:hypothetical protein [Neisseria arctica]KLT73620.1 type IV secretion protein Rhs [Neisseria arctica]UOO85743.1 type IV secretion protein Rhs [Neisseria arctica]
MQSSFRALTDTEIETAKKIFGNSIDYQKVRIFKGIPLLPFIKTAVAPCNSIFFPRSNCPDDFTCTTESHQMWLIHELTHVWQYQNGFKPLLAGIWLALCGGYRHKKAYAYPDLESIRSFSDLNMEQQADMLAHYYAGKYLGWQNYVKQLPLFENILKEFLSNPNCKALLPSYQKQYT